MLCTHCRLPEGSAFPEHSSCLHGADPFPCQHLLVEIEGFLTSF